MCNRLHSTTFKFMIPVRMQVFCGNGVCSLQNIMIIEKAWHFSAYCSLTGAVASIFIRRLKLKVMGKYNVS